MGWLYRVLGNEGAIYRCRLRAMAEPEHVWRNDIFDRGLCAAYSVGVRLYRVLCGKWIATRILLHHL